MHLLSVLCEVWIRFLAGTEIVDNVIGDKMSIDQHRKNVQELYDACKDVSGDTACEKAYRIFKRYLSHRN